MTCIDGDIARLVERAQANERDAFAELVDLYRDAACAVAYSYLGSFDDVQDAVQEAFVQAYVQIGQLREPAKFGPWLRQITANVSKGVLRRPGRAEVSLEGFSEQAATSGSGDPQKSAARIVVREALSRLSEKTRLAVTLSYINGYSHDEVAAFLDVPVNTVRSRLRVAKKQLREEMIDMVSDVLREDKPDGEFAKRIVESFSKGLDLLQSGQLQEALQRDDDELALLEEMRSSLSPEQFKETLIDATAKLDIPEMYKAEFDQRIEQMRSLSPEKLYLLRKSYIVGDKGHMYRLMRQPDEAIKCYEQGLELAMQVPDRVIAGSALAMIGEQHGLAGRRSEAISYHVRAAQTFGEAGKLAWQGRELRLAAEKSLAESDVAGCRSYYGEALRAFESAEDRFGMATCTSALDLIEDVGEDRFDKLVAYGAGCEVLEKRGTAVVSCSLDSGIASGPCEEVFAPNIANVFGQLAPDLPLIDTSVPEDEGWSVDPDWFPGKALHVDIAVRGGDETVTVPAGMFAGCLLMEQVRSIGDLPNHLPEDWQEKHGRWYAGWRLTWYAKSVGPVQMLGEDLSGNSGLIQLKEFSVANGCQDYIPLAIGNRWVFEWPHLPSGYSGRAVFRVVAKEGDRWFVEHYHYATNA